MEETKQSTGLEKVKSAAQLKFETSIATAHDLKNQATAIIISDENTLAQANQILSKINTHLKETKTKGLAMRKPYNEAADIIISFEKLVTTPLDEAIKIGKEKLKQWNDAELEKARLAREEAEKQKKLFNDIVDQLQHKIKICNTVEECEKLTTSINDKWPTDDKFGPYAPEALIQKNFFLNILSTKKISIASNNIDGLKESDKELNNSTQATKEAIQEKQQEITGNISDSVTKSSTRKTPKYEIIDESKLPREWLMPNPDKLKEHLNAIKSTLESGPNQSVEHHGVKFYIDNTVIVR